MEKNTGVAIGRGNFQLVNRSKGRGNFEAPVTKDIGALLLRQPADRLAVGEALHKKIKFAKKKLREYFFLQKIKPCTCQLGSSEDMLDRIVGTCGSQISWQLAKIGKYSMLILYHSEDQVVC